MIKLVTWIKRILFLIACLSAFISQAQQTVLVGAGTTGGGGIFGYNIEEDTLVTYQDFIRLKIPYDREIIAFQSRLFGITSFGGHHDLGGFYSANIDGSDFQIIHHFDSRASGITVNNSEIWGICEDYLFKYTPANGFQVIHLFENGFTGTGSLTFNNNKMWGSLSGGNTQGNGAIFELDPSTLDFTIVHSFVPMTVTNAQANNKLVLSGNKLYGVNASTGEFGFGQLFSIDLDSKEFVTEFSFYNHFDSATFPLGDLIPIENKLYGVTREGGSYNNGTLYSYDIQSGFFKVEHSFSEDTGPSLSLSHINGIIYGNSLNGVIYTYSPDSGEYSLIYRNSKLSFRGKPVLIDDQFFGTGLHGIYRMNSNNEFSTIHNFVNPNGSTIYNSLVLGSDNGIYGMLHEDAKNNEGAVFRLDYNLSNYQLIYEFDEDNGRNPQGSLIEYNNRLWGHTTNGGDTLVDAGVIFSIALDGTDYQSLHSFDYYQSGSYPIGALTISNDSLWGTSKFGGNSNYKVGTLFSIPTDGTDSLFKYHDFDYFNTDNGVYPHSGLLEVSGTFFGTCQFGGVKSSGIIYSFEKNRVTFSKLHDFDGSSITNGSYPQGGLILSSNKLWGMTASGGSHNKGVIYSMNLDGSSFSVVHSFSGSDGAAPKGSLIEYSGHFWGFTAEGGEYGKGVIFKINNDGTNYSKVADLSGSQGTPLYGSLLITNQKVQTTLDLKVATKAYGDPDFTLNATSNSPNTISYSSSNPEVIAISPDGLSAEVIGAGVATITASQAEDDAYTAASTAVEVVVDKVPLNVSVEDQAINVGDPIPSFTITYSGFVNNEDQSVIDQTPTASVELDNTNTAGEFNIILDGGFDSNYSFIYSNGALSISKLVSSIQLEVSAKAYGDPDFTLNATSNSPNTISYSSSNPEVIAISPDGLSAEVIGAGVATITASQAEDDAYTAASTAVEVVVDKVPLNVSVEDQAINVGEPIPSFTITYSGFVNNEDQSVIDQTPTASVELDNTNTAGEYIISIGGGQDNNYEFAYLDGSLIIKLRLQTSNKKNIIFPNPAKSSFTLSKELLLKRNKLMLYNLEGKSIKEFEVKMDNNFDISELESGVYIISVGDEVIGKVIKK